MSIMNGPLSFHVAMAGDSGETPKKYVFVWRPWQPVSSDDKRDFVRWSENNYWKDLRFVLHE